MNPSATQYPEGGAAAAISATLDSIRPLMTLSHDDLVVIALESAPTRPSAGYVTLADLPEDAAAAESGGGAPVEFREHAGGTVSSIDAVVGDKPLVILAGDTIVGGKQNRIINVSVWLTPKHVTKIPVSCLEAGRWDAGRHFRSGRKVDLNLRSKVSRMVTDQVRAGAAARGSDGSARPGYAAQQGAIWAEIAEKEANVGHRSHTGALHDLYETEAVDVRKMAGAFPVPDGATGMAVAIGGRLVALDIFDTASTLKQQWPRLIEAAVSAKFDEDRRVAAGRAPQSGPHHPVPGALGLMLARARGAVCDATISPSVGEGVDVRLVAPKIHGSALVHEDRVIHLSLFRGERHA
ncbi:MAG: DUF6569 family protein [Candidatus Limnocylindrales bacterium]